MILTTEKGGYVRGIPTRLSGSFRINGTSTPDTIRDGNSKSVASVTRVSAGLFTVKFDAGFPVPERLVNWHVELSQAANPTVWSRAHMVIDSWSQSTRSFQVQVLKSTAAGDTADAASDADDNDQVSWEIFGSISSVGTDPA